MLDLKIGQTASYGANIQHRPTFQSYVRPIWTALIGFFFCEAGAAF